MGKNKISNPSVIVELFITYFIEILEKLIDQCSGTYTTYITNLKINICPQIIFINPVS